jgi:hypothetical protein
MVTFEKIQFKKNQISPNNLLPKPQKRTKLRKQSKKT